MISVNIKKPGVSIKLDKLKYCIKTINKNLNIINKALEAIPISER